MTANVPADGRWSRGWRHVFHHKCNFLRSNTPHGKEGRNHIDVTGERAAILSTLDVWMDRVEGHKATWDVPLPKSLGIFMRVGAFL